MHVLQIQIQIQNHNSSKSAKLNPTYTKRDISTFYKQAVQKLANLEQGLYRQQLASNCDNSIVCIIWQAAGGFRTKYYCP